MSQIMAALQPLKIRRGMIRFPLSSKEGNNTNISEKDFDNGKKKSKSGYKIFSFSVF